MSKTRIALAIAIVAFVVLAVPMAAFAETILGEGGTNVWGMKYWAGDPVSGCGCHGPIVTSFNQTPHGAFFTVANGATASIDPTQTKFWPVIGWGTNSLKLNPSDIGYVLGAFSGPVLPTGDEYPGPGHEYTLLDNSGNVTSTGSTYTPVTPADDKPMAEPLTFDHVEGAWVIEGPIGVVAYFQRCGGCHNLGLTRPSDASSSTLGNGATIGPGTPTTANKLGINCEHCHGAPKSSGNHMAKGVTFNGVQDPSMGSNRVLDSQVCGQCHVTGTSTEKRLGSTSAFSNPNGYSPDQTLAAWNVTTTAQGAYSSYHVYNFADDPASATTPGAAGWSSRKFYPDRHNKSMNHVAFNEWMATAEGPGRNGHAASLKTIQDMSTTPASVRNGCLKCHSAEGYLKSIGYKVLNGTAVINSDITTDKFSITCAVCHTPHDPAATAASNGLDLRVDAEVICIQCHTGSIAVGKEATPGATIHEPQLELNAGYGLIDVPTATAFMPGATCVDCHMPFTRANKPSHSFKVMLPGNAETWAVPEMGDSCTPCHKSRTRGDLQDEIDMWTSKVASAAADASAAIAAAKTRPASATATGISLMNRSSTNLSFMNDPGAATHNFPYMLAGMKKATAEARAVGGTLTLGTSASLVSAGGTVFVESDAKAGDGSAAAGEMIVIQKKTAADATFTAIATVTAGADGKNLIKTTVPVKTQFRAYWQASGVDRIFSAVKTVNVRTTTTIVCPTTARLNRSFAIKGKVTPAQRGSKVKIFAKLPGARRFITIATRTLTATGYSFSYKPRKRGIYQLYAQFLGNANFASSKSAVRKTRVR